MPHNRQRDHQHLIAVILISGLLFILVVSVWVNAFIRGAL